MMSGQGMSSSSWMWVFVPLVLALIVTLAMLLVGAYAGPPREGSDATVSSRRPRLGPIAIAVAVLVVATVTVAVAASRSTRALQAGPTCSAPTLPGSTLDVTLADMGGMMAGQMPTWRNGQLMPGTGMAGGGMMGGGMMGGTAPYGRMMSVMVSPASVASGEVSFRVWNAGTIIHELVVMPMPAGRAGTRVVGSDGQVSEGGSLGEASASCGEGTGDGIGPGAVGWVTIRLAPGHYELMCNIAGHYAMGMYTELDVA